mgnify:CR=1 FL=1
MASRRGSAMPASVNVAVSPVNQSSKTSAQAARMASLLPDASSATVAMGQASA